MTNLFSTSLIRNIYKKPSKKSEITSQIIYGEKIKIIKIKNRWLKIKTYNDNYSGYIQKEKLKEGLKIVYKTNVILQSKLRFIIWISDSLVAGGIGHKWNQ